MHAPTLTPNHAPQPHHGDQPQDPWFDADPYLDSARAHGEVTLSRPTHDEFNDLIANSYYGPSAPEPSYASPHPITEYQPTQEFYVGPPQAELDRRRMANLQASFALAHTLRTTNPELIAGLHAATVEPATALVQTPPRRGRYRGRHRR